MRSSGKALGSTNSWLLGALACGLVACSGHASKQANAGGGVFTEGTRLKAVYQQADGAPPFFSGWYDTLLGIDCRFTDVGVPDGVVCLPWGNEVTSDYDAVPGFVDSGCTERVVGPRVFGTGAARFFTIDVNDDDPCGATVRLFPVEAAPIDSSTTVFEPNSEVPGSCEPALGSPQEWRRVGPEIPIESLVRGSYQPRSGAGRIVPLDIIASDGSVQGAASAWDTQRLEAVVVSDTGRWVPSTPYLQLFSDPACSVRAAVGPACQPPAKEFYRSTFAVSGSCEEQLIEHAFEIGAPAQPGADVYYDDVRTSADGVSAHLCTLDLGGGESPAANDRLASFAVGAEIPITAFADSTEVRTGAQQLQLIRKASADGPPTYTVGFFDSVHGQPCRTDYYRPTADGVVRCLPPPAALFPFFADAACSVPVALGRLPTACAPKPAFATRDDTLPSVNSEPQPPRLHFYPIGDAYLGTIYGELEGVCSALGSDGTVDPNVIATITNTAGPEQTIFYSLGPEAPATDFAPVALVHPR